MYCRGNSQPNEIYVKKVEYRIFESVQILQFIEHTFAHVIYHMVRSILLCQSSTVPMLVTTAWVVDRSSCRLESRGQVDKTLTLTWTIRCAYYGE